MRGTIRLTAYERNIELMLVDVRGFSPIGSRVRCQRQPRNICASMPNGKDSNIQVQFMPCMRVSATVLKSKSRYIQ